MMVGGAQHRFCLEDVNACTIVVSVHFFARVLHSIICVLLIPPSSFLALDQVFPYLKIPPHKDSRLLPSCAFTPVGFYIPHSSVFIETLSLVLMFIIN